MDACKHWQRLIRNCSATLEAGDLPAINHLEKIRREKSFKTSKLDIFGTFDNEKAFRRVYEYMAEGRTNDLSNNEKLFLDLLSIINSIDRQVGKRAAIKFLTQQLGYSYDRAADYYNQADALFYSNRNTTKEALRNKYAELLEDLAHAAKNVATTPKDYEAVGEIISKAAKIRKLDEPEIQRLPPQMYMRPLARILADDRCDRPPAREPPGDQRPDSATQYPGSNQEPSPQGIAHRGRGHHRNSELWETERKLKGPRRKPMSTSSL